MNAVKYKILESVLTRYYEPHICNTIMGKVNELFDKRNNDVTYDDLYDLLSKHASKSNDEVIDHISKLITSKHNVQPFSNSELLYAIKTLKSHPDNTFIDNVHDLTGDFTERSYDKFIRGMSTSIVPSSGNAYFDAQDLFFGSRVYDIIIDCSADVNKLLLYNATICLLIDIVLHRYTQTEDK